MLFVNRTFLKTYSRISYITLYIFVNFLFPKLSPTFANEYDKNILDRNLITKESTSNSQIKESSFEYIIGPGDVLYIEIEGIDALTGNVAIEPDGRIFFPEIGSLYVEGMTINEFKDFFTNKISNVVINPSVYVRPEAYRPLKVFIFGEVARSGYYTLNGYQATKEDLIVPLREIFQESTPSEFGKSFQSSGANKRGDNIGLLFPTVYDAIKVAGGINEYSDISKIEVIRKVSKGQGGGKVKATVNLLDLIIEGDESQNIRLFDGDIVKVSRSDKIIEDQIRKVAKTTLSPKNMMVYISGRIRKPGPLVIPTGYSLNQAMLIAGGPRILKGQVELLRFTKDGPINKSKFRYDPSTKALGKNNPILRDGDIIRVKETGLTASFEVINETTQPFVGIFSLLNLIKNFN